MSAKKEKILVTGADGFLGKYVSSMLRDHGIDHAPSAKSNLDILNKKDVVSKIKNFDVIIHLAGNIRTSATDSAENHFNINSLGTLNVLEACRINKVPRIILASSAEVYGNPSRLGRINELDIAAPVDFYGQSKLLAECFCRGYSEKFGINFTVLRFTYLYGWGMYPSRVVSKIINSAAENKKLHLLVGPRAFTDMLYVKDAARAILLVLLNKHSRNKIINISSGRKITVSDLIKTAKYFYPDLNFTISGKKEIGDYYIYDNNLARTILNFRPKYNLRAGFEDYINCMKVNYLGKK